jgi:hypothetical protein
MCYSEQPELRAMRIYGRQYMSLTGTLSRELSNRMDCVQADFERLIEAGANREALERIVKHSLEIGIIKDKLENIHTHEMLSSDD